MDDVFSKMCKIVEKTEVGESLPGYLHLYRMSRSPEETQEAAGG